MQAITILELEFAYESWDMHDFIEMELTQLRWDMNGGNDILEI